MKDEERPALVRPSTARLLWIGGGILLAAALASQLLVHMHAYFGIDAWFGFNAAFGFLSCAAMVLLAWALGYLLKRGEGYYDD